MSDSAAMIAGPNSPANRRVKICCSLLIRFASLRPYLNPGDGRSGAMRGLGSETLIGSGSPLQPPRLFNRHHIYVQRHVSSRRQGRRNRLRQIFWERYREGSWSLMGSMVAEDRDSPRLDGCPSTFRRNEHAEASTFVRARQIDTDLRDCRRSFRGCRLKCRRGHAGRRRRCRVTLQRRRGDAGRKGLNCSRRLRSERYGSGHLILARARSVIVIEIDHGFIVARLRLRNRLPPLIDIEQKLLVRPRCKVRTLRQRRSTLRLLPARPHVPQAIQIGVVNKENRIDRREEGNHEGRAALTAHSAVNVIMRLTLEDTFRALGTMICGLAARKPREGGCANGRSNRGNGDGSFGCGIQVWIGRGEPT